MPTSSTFNAFAKLTKVDVVERLVYGSLASEQVDKTDEVFDYDSSKPHVEEWSTTISKATDGKSVGNLRAMHGKVAAGKFVALECNDKTKSVDVVAKVIDDDEWVKVQEGVYTGFSIGGRYLKKWTDKDGRKRYTAQPSEGSLVDNPANPGSTFTMVKADGTSVLRKFTVLPEPEQGFRAADGSFHKLKDDARRHNEAMAKAKSEAGDIGAAAAEAFAALEKAESARIDPPEAPTAAVVKLGEAVDKRDVSDDERAKLADEGKAMPDGSYPIANVADLKNAIKAFGRAKNKKAVKAHIKARAKALGAENSLPDSWHDGADKALRFGDLRKGLYEVGRLASIIQDLEWVQQMCESEAEHEKDNSPVPEKLKEDIASLCASLREMVEEETNELLDEDEALEYGELLEMSYRWHGIDALAKATSDSTLRKALAKVGMRHGKDDQHHLDAAHDHISKGLDGGCAMKGYGEKDAAAPDALGKASPRHSASDMEHLYKAHEALKAAGAHCPGGDTFCAKMGPEDAPDPGQAPHDQEHEDTKEAMAKRLDEQGATIATLRKREDAATAAFQEIASRLKKLEDRPLPHPRDRAPTGYRVVNKNEEDAEAAEKALMDMAKTDPAGFAQALFAAAHKAPVPPR